MALAFVIEPLKGVVRTTCNQLTQIPLPLHPKQGFFPKDFISILMKSIARAGKMPDRPDCQRGRLNGLPYINIQRAIDPNHNSTQKTLEALIQPLGLKLGVQKIGEAA